MKDYKKKGKLTGMEQQDIARIVRNKDAVDRLPENKVNEAEWYHNLLKGKDTK